MSRRTIRRGVAVLAAAVLLASACSEDRSGTGSGSDGASQSTDSSGANGVESCGPDELLVCARSSSISNLVPAEATEANSTPITLGMINQENTAVGSFPELSQGVQAAIDFVNEQLGGIEGHPVELEVCNTEFSAEGSTSCGQQFVISEVPAVLGGIDVFGNGVDVLADNDVPFVGGIPVSTQSVTSPNSFQWSGGSWGATIAFAAYAASELKAKSAAIIYGDFGSIADGAAYGKRTLEKLGVEDVQLIPYPIISTDLGSPIQAAATSDPDVVFMLTADTGCKAAFDGVANSGMTAQVFYTGACASPAIVSEAGDEKTNGTIFNVEGPINRSDPTPDSGLYVGVVEAYGDGLDPIGSATVSFRSFMNLYVVMRELAAEGGIGAITPDGITDALRSKVDATSFMGHDYTCDGKQLEGLPALCSPQQILGEMQGGQLNQLGTWLDVGKIYGAG